jgi:uncharacterized protein DUF6916
MSISRRRFVKAGVFAAAVAALPLRSILGQSFKERDGNPTDTQPVQADVLGSYSKAAFKSYLGSIFELHTTAGIVEVTLTRVDDLPAPKGGECFSLLFRGGNRAQKQDTYTLVHASMGTFQLLLVPGGADANGAQSYVATLNRLSLADLANMSVPSRVNSARPSGPGSTTTTTVPPSNTATSTPTITAPPAPSPAVVTPLVIKPASPAPTSKRKRRRKPVSKRVDDNLNRIM